METVVTAAIWAGALVTVVGVVVGRFGRPITKLLEARQNEINATAEDTRATAMERQNAAAIASQTIDEQAGLEKARLLQQTAEAQAAAQVHEATVGERVAEERAIIAARTEGRAEAARDRALNGASADQLEIMMEGYKAYLKTGWTCTFDYWLGNIRLDQF
jgi:hypothetical protein